jgi:[ribosomal protein S18]-alanine N-acetyltransferase
MIRFRDYQNKDLEKLYRLDQECFDADIAYSRAELGSYIERRGSFTIIAELENDWKSEGDAKTKFEKGTVAGFIVSELHPKGYGHIITIDTRKEFRRQKLGSRLLQAAEIRLREQEGFMVVLEVAVNNVAAITFYKRHGYSITRTIPRYYNRELDAFMMTKRL